RSTAAGSASAATTPCRSSFGCYRWPRRPAWLWSAADGFLLDQLRAGQKARIAAIAADGSPGPPLLEMGLLEGALRRVGGLAPLGDPMEIRLRDYRLSLRRREAACITVNID